MNEYRLSNRARCAPVPDTSAKTEPFSLVVIQGPYLKSFLSALERQTCFPNEILIVQRVDGDFSSPLPARIIPASGLPIQQARNLGIAAAKFSIVAVVESDADLPLDFLEKLVCPLQGNASIVLSVPQIRFSPWYEWLEQPYQNKPSPISSWYAIALRKNIWARSGGIPEDIPALASWEVFLERLLDQEIQWCQSEARLAIPRDFNLKFLWELAEQEGQLGLFAPWIWRQLPFGLGFAVLFGSFMMSVWLLHLTSIPVAMMAILLVGWLIAWGKSQKVSLCPFVASVLSLVRLIAYAWGVRSRRQVLDLLNNQFWHRLQDILSRHPKVKGVILYLPTHDWHGMFQRPHQMARHLAQTGYLFFYGTRNEMFDAVAGFQQVEERLYLVSIPPVALDIFRTVKPLTLYIGSAWYASTLELFQDALVIYDYYDDLQVSGASLESHAHLLQKADLVLVSSSILQTKVQATRPDALFVPNAVDLKWIRRFQPGLQSPPADLLPFIQSGRPIIGYSGALADWFDYSLLAQVACALPDFEFILLGIDYDGSLQKSGVLEIPNIHWLGQKSYNDELFRYLWYFDVGIIPFVINEITLATSPIKLYEYFACRKPVVSTPLPEVKKYKPVLIAADAEEFIQSTKRALCLARSSKYQQAIETIVEKNTWEQRVSIIIEALDGLQSPKPDRMEENDKETFGNKERN